MNRPLVASLMLVSAALSLSACKAEGCLDDQGNCRVPAPCPRVSFTCEVSTDSLSVAPVTTLAQRPRGWDALATIGDVKLQNDFTEVVIAGLGHQNLLDPNGGSIIDLAPRGGADGVNQILQVVGILPGDAAHYTSMELIDERPNRVAVQVKGSLDGKPDLLVYTRYELTPCDHGVRVRTEIVNHSPDTQLWALMDGLYWSGREAVPFAPALGEGFEHPSFDLLSINDVFHRFPFVAGSTHTNDSEASGFAQVSCTADHLEGFNSDQVSAAGLPRTVVPARGFQVFERFISVADGQGVSHALDTAFEVRRQVVGEQTAVLSGRVERSGALALGEERTASVLISEGTLDSPASARTPWTQVVPAADGTFSARLPTGRPFVVEVHAFGQKQIEQGVTSFTTDVNLGALTLPSSATVTFSVVDGSSMAPVDAEIFLTPTSDDEATSLAGTFHGRFGSCSPWLGAPPGASPACNRVLVHQGTATAEVPAGSFHVYAFHGPFWSLGHVVATFTPGAQQVSLSVTKLPLQPEGTFSGDFHVHGAASFDSSLPDFDRVLAISASALDVIVATDHDVVTDYAKVAKALGLTGHLTTVSGVETTGHIPFLYIPNSGFPLVIGHYNLWPLKFDPSLPRNGGPFDELIEPGALLDRTQPLFTGEQLLELNHPWADAEFGRDLGFPRALSLDLRQNLPTGDDGTSAGIYVRTPAGSRFANDAHHAQEVMNGTENAQYLQYRAFWFYLLNQGKLRTGTANSDSHSLTDNTVGLPRNLVTADTTPGPDFDVDVMNRAVKAGHLIGTNGPVITATITDKLGVAHSCSLTAFTPKSGATVKVKVTSAPWVPVAQVRFVVNGQVVKIIDGLTPPADPFATGGELTRYEGEVAVSELVSGVTADAWLVIEAGSALVATADLGGGLSNALDGMPDTTDNNGDGVIDAKDIASGKKVGPLADPPTPARDSVGWHFYNLTHGYPVAFTNPFVLDLDGDGQFTAPRVKGGR
jgi:hypothetical protein